LTLRIVADGCVLRPWSDADVPALVELCRDAEIVRWLPNIPQPYTDADGRSFVTHALESSNSGDRVEFAIVDEHDMLLGSALDRLLGRAECARSRHRNRGDTGTHRVGVRDDRCDEDRALRRGRQPRIAACGREVRIRAGAGRSQT
jgi:hypothetical protein